MGRQDPSHRLHDRAFVPLPAGCSHCTPSAPVPRERPGVAVAVICGGQPAPSTSWPSPQLDDPVGHVEHHRIVRGHDRGHGLAPDDRAEQEHDRVARLRVELPGRLVGQEQLGMVGERPGDGDPLLLAARQLVRAVTHPVAQARPGRAGPRPLRSRSRGIRVDEAERHLDVLGRGQDRHEAEGLEDERDRAAAAARRAPSSRIVDTSCPSMRTIAARSGGRARRAG